jgi:hypothetical protein
MVGVAGKFAGCETCRHRRVKVNITSGVCLSALLLANPMFSAAMNAQYAGNASTPVVIVKAMREPVPG